MIFQAVFVCLVFLSVFGFVSPAKQLDVRELQTVPLTTIHSVERFLQNNGVYSHAWAYVLQCDNPVAMRDQWNCLAPVYTLLDRLIPPRVGSIQGVFLQVPQSMCELVNKEREQFNLKRANYASLFLGVQLVAGPKSVGETVTTSNCLKREDKGGYVQSEQIPVLMFMEFKTWHENDSYTEKQLANMKTAKENTDAQYVALDAFYASNTDINLLKKHLNGFPIMIYQIQGQKPPNILKLRKVYDMLAHTSKNKVFLMLPRKLANRLVSYVPNIDLTQIPSFVSHIGIWSSVDQINKFIADPKKPFGLFTIFADKGEEVVGTAMLNIRRLLETLRPDRRIILRYPEWDIKYHGVYADFGNWIQGDARAYILFIVANGPNHESCDWLTIGNPSEATLRPKCIYFVGFKESVSKDFKAERMYNTKHFTEIAEILNRPIFKGQEVGLYLNAEFLAHRLDLSILKAIKHLKYLIVYSDYDFTIGSYRLWLLQNNIRELGLETILRLPEDVLQRTHEAPVIDHEISHGLCAQQNVDARY